MSAIASSTECPPVVDRLREQLGPKKIKEDEMSRVAYSSDTAPVPPQKPLCVIFPETREDVVAALKIANEHKTPLTVMSGGVNVTGNCVPSKGGMVMDLRRMDRILEINTDSGYAVIEPGVNFDRFSAALAEKGYRCQIPTAPGGATPLGNYTSRPTGSLTTRQLDAIVTLEVVLPDGTIFNTGSSAFPNAGASLRYGPFPDLAGLFLCAYGTLGVITRASIRIYPINEANRLNITVFDSIDQAVAFVKDVTANNIAEHTVIWNWQLVRSFEVNIVADEYKVPADVRSDPRTPPKGLPYNIVTTFMSGYEETMQSHEKVCAKVAAKCGGRMLGEEEACQLFPAGIAGWTELYRKYRPLEPTFFGLGQYLPWIVIVEPRMIKDLEQWAVAEFSEFGTSPVCYYVHPFDFGRAMMFRIFCFPDPKNEELISRIVGKYREMFQVAMRRYGSISMRARSGWPPLTLTGSYGDVLTRIKRSLDPNNILSPNMKLFEDVAKEGVQ